MDTAAMYFIKSFTGDRSKPVIHDVAGIEKAIRSSPSPGYNESLQDVEVVKPYFDSDARYVRKKEVTKEEKARVFALFQKNVATVMEDQDGFDPAQVVYGQRHGIDAKHPERPHKISFRAWVQGWKVRYPMLKDVILAKRLNGEQDGLLDASVYQPRQILNCMLCQKGKIPGANGQPSVMDARVLRPTDDSVPFGAYFVQNLTGEEKEMEMSWQPRRSIAGPSTPRDDAGSSDAPVPIGIRPRPMEFHPDFDDLLDIFEPHRVDDRAEWVNVGHHLKAIGEENFRVWDNWSRQSDKYPGSLELRSVWDSIHVKASSEQAIRYLQAKARRDNPERFESHQQGSLQARVEDIVAKKGSHLSIARFMRLKYQYNVVVVGAKRNAPSYYTFEGHTWKHRDSTAWISKLICEQVLEALNTYLGNYRLEDKEEAKRSAEVLVSVISNLENSNFRQGVIADFLVLLLVEDDLAFDADTNLIGFENGVYDLEAGEFRDGVPEDLVTMSTCADYPEDVTAERAEELDTFLSQILVEPDVRGSLGGNGKSTLVNLVAKAFGQYAFKVGSDIITSGRPSSFNGNPLLVKMRGVRFVYIEEPEDENSKLNGAWIKELTGGTPMTARLNYSNDYVEFMPQWHIYALANKVPELNGSDGGLQRRVRQVDFKAFFTNEFAATEENPHVFPEITDLSDKIDRLAPALMRLLLDRYVHDYRYSCPESVLASSRALMAENDPFAYFVDLALKRDSAKQSYITVKQARAAWKELSAEPDHDRLRVIPKEGELRANIERLMRCPCIKQTWIYRPDGSKVKENSVFRGLALTT